MMRLHAEFTVNNFERVGKTTASCLVLAVGIVQLFPIGGYVSELFFQGQFLAFFVTLCVILPVGALHKLTMHLHDTSIPVKLQLSHADGTNPSNSSIASRICYILSYMTGMLTVPLYAVSMLNFAHYNQFAFRTIMPAQSHQIQATINAFISKHCQSRSESLAHAYDRARFSYECVLFCLLNVKLQQIFTQMIQFQPRLVKQLNLDRARMEEFDANLLDRCAYFLDRNGTLWKSLPGVNNDNIIPFEPENHHMCMPGRSDLSLSLVELYWSSGMNRFNKNSSKRQLARILAFATIGAYFVGYVGVYYLLMWIGRTYNGARWMFLSSIAGLAVSVLYFMLQLVFNLRLLQQNQKHTIVWEMHNEEEGVACVFDYLYAIWKRSKSNLPSFDEKVRDVSESWSSKNVQQHLVNSEAVLEFVFWSDVEVLSCLVNESVTLMNLNAVPRGVVKIVSEYLVFTDDEMNKVTFDWIQNTAQMLR